MTNVFLKTTGKRALAAIFLSGKGSVAENLLADRQEKLRNGGTVSWDPAVIVTDRPKTSRAKEIAEKFGLPFVCCGILDFYRSHGLEHVTLDSPKARAVRELWTNRLRECLTPYKIDFGLLAGFVPLSNIVEDYPCLNVHPGDLTVENENGDRIFVGLHTVPVELAMLYGPGFLRSSVIIVEPSTKPGASVDSGHLLGISEKVPVDFQGHSKEELLAIYKGRKEQRHGANKDVLFDLASYNQERLKEGGDWILYPRVAEDFAAGLFGYDENNHLMFRENLQSEFKRITTLEYSKTTRKEFK